MTVAILVGLFALLLILGFPIAFSMSIASVAAVVYQGGIPLNMIVHRTVMGVDSFVYLAIPMFIFAGTIMEQGGISERLIHFARTIVGRFRGGLAMGVVFGTILESGVSGSTAADVSAMCSMTLDPLERAGYSKPYSLAVIGSSCAFAILVPPCILMVIVAAIANVSVIALFAAGVLPSIVFGILSLVLIHIQARRYNLPRDEACSFAEIVKGLKDALVALGIPIVIFGGIRLGVATVTEMAAITVIYAMLAGGFVYRSLNWKGIRGALVLTAVSTAQMAILFGFAMIFGYIIATQGVPKAIAAWMSSVGLPPWGALLMTAAIFIPMGSILEGAPASLIFVPILQPLMQSLGIDLVHWLTIVVLATGIGLFLPPSGLAVIMACGIGKVKMEELIIPMMPFMAMLLVGMLLMIFIPDIVTVGPRWLGLEY